MSPAGVGERRHPLDRRDRDEDLDPQLLLWDEDPGYPVPVTVAGSLRRLTEIWRVDVGWADALRTGTGTSPARSVHSRSLAGRGGV